MKKITVTKEEFATVLRQKFFKCFDDFCSTTEDGPVVPFVLEALVGSALINFCYEYKKEIFGNERTAEAELDRETLSDAETIATRKACKKLIDKNMAMESIAVVFVITSLTTDIEKHYFNEEDE